MTANNDKQSVMVEMFTDERDIFAVGRVDDRDDDEPIDDVDVVEQLIESKNDGEIITLVSGMSQYDRETEIYVSAGLAYNIIGKQHCHDVFDYLEDVYDVDVDEYANGIRAVCTYVFEEKEYRNNDDVSNPVLKRDLLDKLNDVSSDMGRDNKINLKSRVLKYWQPQYYFEDPDDVEIAQNFDDKEAIHKTACFLEEDHEFIYPESNEQLVEWRNLLYVYDDSKGVWTTEGRAVVKERLEKEMAPAADSVFIDKVVEKIQRRNRKSRWDIQRIEDQKDPYELVVRNGVLDLRTGELHNHDATYYAHTSVDIEYDPEAECPAIDEFLSDIVHEEDIPTLYRTIAQTLIDEYVTEKAVLLNGSGDNGKSVFLDLLGDFLGSDNVSSESLYNLTKKTGAGRWSEAQLHGKLANISAETEMGTEQHASVFKGLTGRDETQDGEHKHEDRFSFENSANLIFAANSVPEMPADEKAIWRRWVYVNFPFTFGNGPDADKEPEPRREMMNRMTTDQELSGLLNRCVEEIQRYCETEQEFFADREEWTEVRKRMRAASNPLEVFGDECLQFIDDADESDGMMLSKSEVREAYEAYAEVEDLPRFNAAVFGQKFSSTSSYHGDKRANSYKDGGRTWVYKKLKFTDKGRKMIDLHEKGEPEAERVDNDGDEEEQEEEQEEVTREDVETAAEERPGMNPYELMEYVGADPEKFELVYEVVEEQEKEQEQETREEDDGTESIGEELARPKNDGQQQADGD